MSCENSIQGLVQYRQNYHKIHLFSAVLSLGLEHDTQTQADYIEGKHGPGPEPDTSIDEFGNVIDEYGEIID